MLDSTLLGRFKADQRVSGVVGWQARFVRRSFARPDREGRGRESTSEAQPSPALGPAGRWSLTLPPTRMAPPSAKEKGGWFLIIGRGTNLKSGGVHHGLNVQTETAAVDTGALGMSEIEIIQMLMDLADQVETLVQIIRALNGLRKLRKEEKKK